MKIMSYELQTDGQSGATFQRENGVVRKCIHQGYKLRSGVLELPGRLLDGASGKVLGEEER